MEFLLTIFLKNISQSVRSTPLKNLIFIILVVLRRSVLRVAGSISAAKRLGNTALKKRRSGGEPLATLRLI